MLFNHTASELTGLCGHALDLAKNMGAAVLPICSGLSIS